VFHAPAALPGGKAVTVVLLFFCSRRVVTELEMFFQPVMLFGAAGFCAFFVDRHDRPPLEGPTPLLAGAGRMGLYQQQQQSSSVSVSTVSAIRHVSSSSQQQAVSSCGDGAFSPDGDWECSSSSAMGTSIGFLRFSRRRLCLKGVAWSAGLSRGYRFQILAAPVVPQTVLLPMKIIACGEPAPVPSQRGEVCSAKRRAMHCRFPAAGFKKEKVILW
jgi:hypothetical protein